MNKILMLTLNVLLLCSCVSTSDETVLKLGHGLDQSHSVHQGMVYMAEYLEKISEGKMRIDIYPSAQLGSETQCVELLQIGSLAMTKVSAAALESFIEEFKVFGLPYLFTSKEHHFNVLDGSIGEDILEAMSDYMLRGLGYFDAGSRNFYTMGKLIKSPTDLKGYKIRVMKSPMAIEMMQCLGGSATPISWPELYTALQSGVVDGAENNLPSFYLSRHYEVVKHLSMNEHTMIPDVLVISKNIWDNLTKEEKDWLSQAVKEGIAHQRKLWAAQEIECLDKLIEAGVEVHYPDKKPFIELTEAIHESFMTNKYVSPFITRIKKSNNEKINR